MSSLDFPGGTAPGWRGARPPEPRGSARAEVLADPQVRAEAADPQSRAATGLRVEAPAADERIARTGEPGRSGTEARADDPADPGDHAATAAGFAEPLTGTAPALATARPAPGLQPATLLAGLGWFGAAALLLFWPDLTFQPLGTELALIWAGVGALLVALGAGGDRLGRVGRWTRARGPWLLALAGAAALWTAVTAKTGLLPAPFFPTPQAMLEVFAYDWPKILHSAGFSVALLAKGFGFGAAAGFLIGIAMGWSRLFSYWATPLLRYIGPLPATAWLPLAFFVFPTSGSASVFLIAFSTAFPVAVLTWSGVAAVNRDYYEIARTLGASPWFLIRKVAIPAALPHVFVGLFMGLSTSFAVLVVAEMLGVEAGLGWYLQWAQGWAAYANMYAALFVMAAMCSGLITLLFRIRDRVLTWQKGVVRW